MAEETRERLEEIEEKKKSQETTENSERVKATETSETPKELKEPGEFQESKESEKMSPDDLMAMWEEALKEAQTSETQKQESSKEFQKRNLIFSTCQIRRTLPSSKNRRLSRIRIYS